MNCQDFQILLNRDLDGMLDAAGRNQLSAHLASCASCRADQESFQAIRAACRDLKHVDVRAGLAEHIAGQAARPRTPILHIPRHALVPIAASIMALCLVSGALGWHFKEPGHVQAAPNWKRIDEAQFRSFLADQLTLPADRIDAILKIRRETDQKWDAAQADLQERSEQLQKSEIEQIWRILPPEARERYLEHDRSFTPPAASPR